MAKDKGKKDKAPPVRSSQVQKLRNAFAANAAAQREGYDDAEIRRTAAVLGRLVDNSSDAELSASV
ncbi:MAG: hypothetical protein ABR585_07960 [Gemmatimonadaceae bacterium]